MVGEIRDKETADIALRSALTGHLVFSTLHTNDSASALTRLLDMGCEPFLVTRNGQCGNGATAGEAKLPSLLVALFPVTGTDGVAGHKKFSGFTMVKRDRVQVVQ